MAYTPSSAEPSTTASLTFRSSEEAAGGYDFVTSSSFSSSSATAHSGVHFPFAFDSADTESDLALRSFSSSEQQYASPTQQQPQYASYSDAPHSSRPPAPQLSPPSDEAGVASASPFVFASSSDAAAPFSPVWRMSASSPVSSDSAAPSVDSEAVKPSSAALSSRLQTAESAAVSTSSSSSPSPSPSPSLVRRLKHREIDAARKQREISLFRELEALTDVRPAGAAAAGCAGSSSSQQEETADGGRQRKRRKAKRGQVVNDGDKRKEKVSVLQASIDRIRSLERRCDALSSAVEQHDSDDSQRWAQLLQRLLAGHPTVTADSDSASASPLALLAPAARDTLSYLVHHHSLYASGFLLSPFCLVITAVSTGRVLDANARFFNWSGWERAEIVNKRFTRAHSVCSPSGSFPLHPPPQTDFSDAPLVRAGPGKERRPAIVPPQFPRSVELKKELLDGRLSMINAVWRNVMADGRVWEVECRTWISRYDSIEDGHGRAIRIPQEMTQLFEEGKLVDDWDWGRQAQPPQRSSLHGH